MSQVEKIKNVAKDACFFVNDGTFLRMQYCEEEDFCAMDEESGEEYKFTYEELVGTNPRFFKIVPMTIE